MILIAGLIYLFLVWKRNLREAASVGIWAFIAIAVRQWNNHHNIAIIAIIATVILAVATGIHGFKNRYFSPSAKIKRKEWS
jgi:chromate transport protein ChrA